MELMKQLGDKSVDCIITDPPYNITANNWDIAIDLEALFAEYMRIVKDKGAVIIFGNQPFTTDLINAGRKWFRYELIWTKSKGSDFFNAKVKPMKAHENILVFSKKQEVYNPQLTEGKPYTRHFNTRNHYLSSTNTHFIRKWDTYDNKGTRFPLSHQHFKREQGLHTTQKPVPLMEWLVKTYSNIGDLVLDSFSGSGTTAIACINTHRRFIGYELTDKYYKVAKDRINQNLNNCIMPKSTWKKPKAIYRLTIVCGEDTLHEDLLLDETTPEAMTDFYSYFNWLFGEDDWEIVECEEDEIMCWKDMRASQRWRGFYRDYGEGADLHL
jgi:site-specific DNA-methyltransferase (adenine-specific)